MIFYTCARNLWKILLQILLKIFVGMFTDLTGLNINCLTFLGRTVQKCVRSCCCGGRCQTECVYDITWVLIN